MSRGVRGAEGDVCFVLRSPNQAIGQKVGLLRAVLRAAECPWRKFEFSWAAE